MSKLTPRQAFISNVVFAFIGIGLGHFGGTMLWEMKKAEGKRKAARRRSSERKAVVCSHCGARR